jgi:hypothetical protein
MGAHRLACVVYAVALFSLDRQGVDGLKMNKRDRSQSPCERDSTAQIFPKAAGLDPAITEEQIQEELRRQFKGPEPKHKNTQNGLARFAIDFESNAKLNGLLVRHCGPLAEYGLGCDHPQLGYLSGGPKLAFDKVNEMAKRQKVEQDSGKEPQEMAQNRAQNGPSETFYPDGGYVNPFGPPLQPSQSTRDPYDSPAKKNSGSPFVERPHGRGPPPLRRSDEDRRSERTGGPFLDLESSDGGPELESDAQEVEETLQQLRAGARNRRAKTLTGDLFRNIEGGLALPARHTRSMLNSGGDVGVASSTSPLRSDNGEWNSDSEDTAGEPRDLEQGGAGEAAFQADGQPKPGYETP